MIVARTPQEIKNAISDSCVTIGNFDGVHKGHQKLLSTVRDTARSRKLLSVVVTFDPHPLRVLLAKKTPPFITLTSQKLELIAGLGIELALVLEFNREMAALTPEEFIRRYLVEDLSMKELVVGYDYAMGKGRSGDFTLLSELGRKMGYNARQLDPVIMEGAIVSSTRIRDLVEAGDVWDVLPLLGRFYQVSGTVIKGRDRGGKLLGFPTANLQLTDELFPKPGVYAIWVEAKGEILPAVANIGYNPTFGNDAISVEAHILDYSGDLYGQSLWVHFVQRIRSERKFSGIEELKARIGRDIELARRILMTYEARAVRTEHIPLWNSNNETRETP